MGRTAERKTLEEKDKKKNKEDKKIEIERTL